MYHRRRVWQRREWTSTGRHVIAHRSKKGHSVIGLRSALPPATASGAERRRAEPKYWLQAASYEQSSFRLGTCSPATAATYNGYEKGRQCPPDASTTRRVWRFGEAFHAMPTIGLRSTAWTLRDGKMVAQRLLNGCPLILKMGEGQIV